MVRFSELVARLLEDKYLVFRLKETYANYRNSGVLTKEALLQVVDNYAEMLNQSQQLNFMRWNILNRSIQFNPVIHGSYEGEVANVKRYISERIDWIDNKLCYQPSGNATELSGLSNIIVYTGQNAICFDNISETARITIVDVTGRMIVSKSIRYNESIPVAKGLYFVTIADAKSNTRSIKCLVSGQ